MTTATIGYDEWLELTALHERGVAVIWCMNGAKERAWEAGFADDLIAYLEWSYPITLDEARALVGYWEVHEDALRAEYAAYCERHSDDDTQPLDPDEVTP